MLKFRDFSHAHQMFNKMLGKALICVFGQWTYVEGKVLYRVWVERMTSI